MSFDGQVALARLAPHGESTHLSRAARQVVPPFLQKLYEIVNDPANEELIKWSDNGDSFYVLNHEKFAREVLGRWFKHQKFASFVRQLNMYGFHKIPHLQQGVLKSDTDTEPWHFEHPNFHRGQPDLLCLIQRKKQPTHGQPDDPVLDIHDPTHPTSPLASVAQGHLMDINSIVNGVAAIKRHQQAISSDLNSLKQSNDALWKEAIAARQRHAKHQDTINRVLKFLAGVFGHTDEGAAHSPDGSHTPPQVTPRVRQRLMIANGRASPKGKNVEITEVNDDDADVSRMKKDPAITPEHYASIETPTSITAASIESIAPTEVMTPMSDFVPDPSKSPPIRPSQILSRTNSAGSLARFASGSVDSAAPTTPTLPSSTSGQNSADAIWQAAIQHMISSPTNIQRIMQAIANQQPIPNLSPPPPDTIAPHATNSSAIATYDPNQYQSDFVRWLSQPSSPPSSSGPVSQPHPLADYADDNPMQLLPDESSRLQKSYRDAAEIDAEMDMLQSSINSLIQNLGIDPNSLSPPPEDPVPPAPPPGPLHPHTFGHPTNGFISPGGLDGSNGDASHPDYLLDSLLSQIGDGAGAGVGGPVLAGLDYADITDHYDPNTRIDGTSIEDASTEQLTAFLDEAASSTTTTAATTPPTPATAGNSPDVHPIGLGGAARQKRKSEVVDVLVEAAASPAEGGAGKKAKRKR